MILFEPIVNPLNWVFYSSHLTEWTLSELKTDVMGGHDKPFTALLRYKLWRGFGEDTAHRMEMGHQCVVEP